MIVAGIGFRAQATTAALRAALDAAQNAAPAGCNITALAVFAEKADSPALQALARDTNLTLHALTRDQIAQTPTPTQSPRIQTLFATGSLAEALALTAAGPGARLITPRHTSPDGTATAALAESLTP